MATQMFELIIYMFFSATQLPSVASEMLTNTNCGAYGKAGLGHRYRHGHGHEMLHMRSDLCGKKKVIAS